MAVRRSIDFQGQVGFGKICQPLLARESPEVDVTHINVSTCTALIARLGNARDSEAWQTFNENYQLPIKKWLTAKLYANSQTNGRLLSQVDDMCQLVLLALSEALKKGRYDRSLGPFRPYLLGIAHHVWCRFIELNKKSADLSGVDEHVFSSWTKDFVSEIDRINQQELFTVACQKLEEQFGVKKVQIFWRMKTRLKKAPPSKGLEDIDTYKEFGLTHAAVASLCKRITKELEKIMLELECPSE